MKITRKKLTQALALVAKTAETRSTMPALESVMITANGTFSMRATNLDSALRVDIEGTGEPFGPVAVNAKAFKTLAAKLKSTEFDISGDAEGLTITAGKRTLNLPKTIDCDDFPAWPSDAPPASVTLTSDRAARLLDRVLYAVSTDETRQHLNGVLLEDHMDSLRAVATDGHRLSQSDEPATCTGEFGVPFIAEPNSLRVLRHALKSADPADPVEMSSSEEYCRARVQSNGMDVRVAGRRRHDKFPPYDRVIPSVWTTRATVDRAAFTECMKLAKGLAGRDSSNATLTFNGCIELQMTGDDCKPMYSEKIESDNEGPDLTSGFDVCYLLDAMKGIETDRIELSLGEDIDTLVIREEYS